MGLLEDYLGLATALAIGLLLGLERGWHRRDAPEGSRIAGFRTIALIGLLGGVLAILSRSGGSIILAGGLIGVSLLLGVGFLRDKHHEDDVSITTLIAALLAAALGALAGWGYPRLAFSSAVVAALLLSLKPALHGFLKHMDEDELKAVIRFLIISAVVLPLLPNQGYGPYEALNPYIIWWMVVLISGLSFAGYIAVRVFGERQGLLLTAGFGALVSSTAITLAFAREARIRPASAGVLSAAILLASTVMFLRMAFVALVISPALYGLLLPALFFPILTGVFGVYLAGRKSKTVDTPDYKLDNPFDLSVALLFGAGLGLVILGARYLEAEFGTKGLLTLAWVTGIMDVDAMTISASQMVQTGLEMKLAVMAIISAAVANSIAKCVLAFTIARTAMPGKLLFGFLFMILAGFASLIGLHLL